MTTVVPIDVASIASADDVFAAFDRGIITSEEARIMLGLEDPRVTIQDSLPWKSNLPSWPGGSYTQDFHLNT